MAPRTRNSNKQYSRGRKKDVRFPRREAPVRKSATVVRTPENYENLILHYLTKLKRLFSAPDHPHPKSNENSADKMKREQLTEKQVRESKSKSKSKIEIDPSKYTSRRSTPKPREDLKDIEHDMKERVYNIVNAAIEYGFANNVLEKKGDCFIFKNRKNSKLANRQPTPGPSVIKKTYCSQCNCNRCKSFSTSQEQCQKSRPFSESSPQRHGAAERRSRPTTSVNPSRYHDSKAHSLSRAMNRISLNGINKSSRSRSCIVSRSNVKDRLRRVCQCRRCKLLDQKRKQQKK